MNVHLIRSKEFNKEAYWDVINLLQNYPGPLKFIPSDEPITHQEINSTIWEDEESFKTQGKFSLNKEPTDLYKKIIFPKKDKILSWKNIFKSCNKYRKENDLGNQEVVFLLTDIANKKNWFSAGDEKKLNGFIHTANWEYYFPGADRRFPLAYQTATLVLQTLMFDNYKILMSTIHDKPIGCMMDFCENKEEIVHKMRTADICSDCLSHMQINNVPKKITIQAINIMEGVRTNMLFKQRFKLLQQPSEIEIRTNRYRLFLKDFGDLEIRLTPLEKTIYFLFLNHTKGIKLNHLHDHQQEVINIYSNISTLGSMEDITEKAKNLTDPLSNSASEKISKIKNKFERALGNEMAKHYCIQGENAELKKITLNRELVKPSFPIKFQ